MRELLKDWRRWSTAERVAALVILSISLIGLPTVLSLNGIEQPSTRGTVRAEGGVP